MAPFFAGISYLNSAPYFSPWLLGGVKPPSAFRLAPPAAVNEAVVEGRAYGGLMSAAAFARTRGLRRLPGLEIASIGPVRSILLAARSPREGLSRIHVTTESATSVALLERLLRLEGWAPRIEPSADPLEAIRADDEAALLIGDAALALDRSAWLTWDLGEWWFGATGLPMVFAVTAIRDEHVGLAPRLEEALRESLAWSAGHLDDVVTEWYARTGGPIPPDARGYLEGFARARTHPRLEEGLAAFTGGILEAGGGR